MANAVEGILYCLVANAADQSTISEYARSKGTLAVNAKKVLQSVPKGSGEKRSFMHNKFCYNVMSDGSLTYLCVTEEGFSRITAFNFLNSLKAKCPPFKGNPSQMHNKLKSEADFFSDPKNDKITKIKTEIGQVKEVMIDNIEKILERGDKIDTLVSKTEELDNSAKDFQTGAKDLKWKMWKKRMMMIMIITFVVLLIIFLIVLFACSESGVNFKKCGQKQ